MTAPATRLERALESHRSGEHREAERRYRQILDRDPRHGDALMLLGVLSCETGRPDQAEHFLGRAIEVRPADARAHYNLGIARRTRGALEAAVGAFETATRMAPDHASAFFNLGLTRLEMGDRDRAIANLNRAVHLDPAHVRARHQLALLLLERGDAAEAAAHWQAAIETAPDDADLHLHLGLALHASGAAEEAAERFLDVTRIAPERADGWCNLGGALRSTGRPEDAVEALERALTLDPDLASAHVNLAEAHLDRHEPAAALTSAARAVEIAPADPAAARTVARCLRDAGAPREAERHLRRGLAARPDDPTLATELADLLRETSRPDEAERQYRAVLHAAPECADARAALVELTLDAGRLEEADRESAEALRCAPDHLPTIAAACRVEATRGRAIEAIARIETALARADLGPHERRALRFRLGELHERNDDPEAAWTAYVEANGTGGARAFDRDALRLRIDAIRTVFDHDRMPSLHRAAQDGPIPIFIVGMPLSGAEVIEQVIADHPEIAVGGASGLLSSLVATLETSGCAAEAYPQSVAALGMAEIQSLADFGRAALEEMAGPRPVVTDRSTGSILALGLAEILFPHARVVFCLRDPLDTGVSCYFHNFSGRHPYAYDLDDLAFVMDEHRRLVDHWRGALSLPMMTVSYDALASEPESVTRRLRRFCDPAGDDPGPAEPLPGLDAARAVAAYPRTHPLAVGRHREHEAHLDPLRPAPAAIATGGA